MLKILSAPHTALTAPVKPIEIIDDLIKKLVIDMENTLMAQVDPQGVGLAAPQVGVSRALFIIKPTVKSETEVFINPKILKFEVRRSKLETIAKRKTQNAKRKETKLEGCLSIPRIWGPVKRPHKVLVEYQDIDGVKKQEWFSGLKAVIVQHEVDHLQGILFTQRALEQKTPLYEEKGDEFVKIESTTV